MLFYVIIVCVLLIQLHILNTFKRSRGRNQAKCAFGKGHFVDLFASIFEFLHFLLLPLHFFYLQLHLHLYLSTLYTAKELFLYIYIIISITIYFHMRIPESAYTKDSSKKRKYVFYLYISDLLSHIFISSHLHMFLLLHRIYLS